MIMTRVPFLWMTAAGLSCVGPASESRSMPPGHRATLALAFRYGRPSLHVCARPA